MLNRTQIIGHVGKDPVTRSANGRDVTNFSVAVTKKWKSQNGEKQEKTTWFSVSCWGNLSKIASDWVKKGSQIYVEGEISINEYTNEAGESKASLVLTASNIELLGGKSEGGQSQQQSPAHDWGESDNASVDFTKIDF
jgi:single-strand DNA-binding protein